MSNKRVAFVLGLVAWSLCVVTKPARADVPAGYKGTPYMGTPRAIPGRVNLIDFDDGGAGVGYMTVHSNGDVGCAGYDYRPKPVPTLCKTSGPPPGENDHWTAGPMMGTQFPSAGTSDYYVGAIRPGDWVQVTVDVKTAGMYQLSTSWASAGGSIDVKISMNGTMVTEYKGAATGDYHNWVPGPNFAQVMLTAGVQVMRFQSVVEHVNMDYVQFTLVGAGGTLDPSGSGGSSGTGAAGSAGSAGASGGAGAGGSAGATTGAAGDSGTTGAAGGGVTGAAGAATGAAGDPGTTGAAGAGTGAAGDSGATGAAGASTGTGTGAAGAGSPTGAGTGAAGSGAGAKRASSGGCALAGDTRGQAAWLVLGAAVAIAVGSRRRARRRNHDA